MNSVDPLFVEAVMQGNLLEVNLLLANGADPNQLNHFYNYSEPVIFEAVRQGQDSIIQSLVNAGALVNRKSKNGTTAIFFASHEDMISYMIANGADVNLKSKQKSQETVLENPASFESATAFISHVSDINMKNSKNQTAIFAVSDFNIFVYYKNIMSFNYLDNDGKSILHTQCENGNYEIVEYILDNLSQDINLQDNFGNTPMYYANNENVIQLLYLKGAIF